MKQFGPKALVDMAHTMGVKSWLDPVESLCVGSADVPVYQMVSAFNTFPGRGVYAEPVYVTRIEDKMGNVLATFTPRRREAVSEQTAYLMVNLMKGDTEAAKAYTANASKETKALAAAAEGNYAAAQSALDGYNAAVAATMNADYTAAKQYIANDKSAKADYLRAVIAAKQGDFAAATAELKSAIAKDASYAEKCKKDVNLRNYIGKEIVL